MTRRGMPGRRRFLDDLLVASLHRAVALAEPDRVLVLVGEHLDLDVARVLEELLQVHGGVAEGGAGFGARGLHRRDQRRLRVDDAHAAAAAAARGLDDDRIADRARRLDDLLRVFRAGRPPSPGTQGTPDLIMACLAETLSPIVRIESGRRADEGEAAALHPLGEVGVFGEEAVAGVDRLGVGDLGGRDDGRHVEVALRRGRGPDADGFVGELDVLGVAVGLGIDHHRLDAELAAGALDPQGDFPAVGDQDLLEHARGRVTR